MRVRDCNHPGQAILYLPNTVSNCAPVTRIAAFYKEDGSADTYFIPAELPVHTLLIRRLLQRALMKVLGQDYDAFYGPEVELSSREAELLHSPLMGRAPCLQVPALSLCLIMQSRHCR